MRTQLERDLRDARREIALLRGKMAAIVELAR